MRIVRNLVVALVLGIVGYMFVPIEMTSFSVWFVMAILVGAISSICICGINYVCEPNEFKSLLNRVKGVLKK